MELTRVWRPEYRRRRWHRSSIQVPTSRVALALVGQTCRVYNTVLKVARKLSAIALSQQHGDGGGALLRSWRIARGMMPSDQLTWAHFCPTAVVRQILPRSVPPSFASE